MDVSDRRTFLGSMMALLQWPFGDECKPGTKRAWKGDATFCKEGSEWCPLGHWQYPAKAEMVLPGVIDVPVKPMGKFSTTAAINLELHICADCGILYTDMNATKSTFGEEAIRP
jgi:hypothetical protein